jgi:hypothetical protein
VVAGATRGLVPGSRFYRWRRFRQFGVGFIGARVSRLLIE